MLRCSKCEAEVSYPLKPPEGDAILCDRCWVKTFNEYHQKLSDSLLMFALGFLGAAIVLALPLIVLGMVGNRSDLLGFLCWAVPGLFSCSLVSAIAAWIHLASIVPEK